MEEANDVEFDETNDSQEEKENLSYVRNDELRTDYEILLDTRTYRDAKKTFLMPSDDE